MNITNRLSMAAIPLVCALLGGCGSPASLGPGSPVGAKDRVEAMAKLQKLNDEGQKKFTGDSHTHAEVSGWYLAELQSIELDACPQEFVEKFRKYQQSWVAIQKRSENPPEGKRGIKSYVTLFQQLHGEMSPSELAHGRDDDAMLNELLLRARELKRAAATK